MKYECTHCKLNESESEREGAPVMAAAATARTEKNYLFYLEFGLSCSYLHIAGRR